MEIVNTAAVKPKKKRAPKTRFDQNDVDLLIECALKEKDSLENKRTDNPASQMKNEAWVRIAESFNAATSGAVSSNSPRVCVLFCVLIYLLFSFVHRVVQPIRYAKNTQKSKEICAKQ